jgi:hypothetical protein
MTLSKYAIFELGGGEPYEVLANSHLAAINARVKDIGYSCRDLAVYIKTDEASDLFMVKVGETGLIFENYQCVATYEQVEFPF